MSLPDDLRKDLGRTVAEALVEDAACRQLTASLIDADTIVGATVIAGESLVLAGAPWVDAVFAELDDRIVIDWYVHDGQGAEAGDVICKLVGPAQALLAGERTAMNFLQTLSATATRTAACVAAAAGTSATIRDTRRTLPGLRRAQAYAVTCGGGRNTPFASHDAVLIEASHVKNFGSIRDAVAHAGTIGNDIIVAAAVRNHEELLEALDAGVAHVVLVDFTAEALRQAVATNAGYGYLAAELEASGNYLPDDIGAVAATGVNYVSTPLLTSAIEAVALSVVFRID